MYKTKYIQTTYLENGAQVTTYRIDLMVVRDFHGGYTFIQWYHINRYPHFGLKKGHKDFYETLFIYNCIFAQQAISIKCYIIKPLIIP